MEPMLLKPECKETLWGGTRLKNEFGKQAHFSSIAETWECSAHPAGLSVVRNGSFTGWTLDKVLDQHPDYLGTRVKGKELPILVKFIDAERDLSLQVHPGDEYARVHENDFGKTEMWYVVDAKKGASLVHGFAHNVDRIILENGITEGSLLKNLNKVEVHKGDVFYTPAGTIHGIGAGCLIAEIQENSNVTYRVYDYDRIDKNGDKRPLHFEKAIEVLDMNASNVYRQRPKLIKCYPGCNREILCRCKYFETERIEVKRAFSFSVLKSSFQVLLCINGSGGLELSEYKKPLRFNKGDCLFLPAGLGRCFVVGDCELLKVRV